MAMQELDSFPINSACCFCQQTKNDELLYGKICQLGDIITHYFCMLFSSQMEQNGKDEDGILGFLPNDINKELIRGKKLNCVYCHIEGATINCSFRGCKKRYHYPCAVDNGALHEFFDQFRSFCLQHRRIQVVTSRRQETSICVMCRENVKCEPSRFTLWAPCCRTAWFHRSCVQKMAISAGYFFKCPNCNDKDKFRREMLDCGIYIPDQDASWELEDNAFHELNERHNECDTKNCRCPKGRKFSTVEGAWEIVLCSLCGSQGTHVRCSKIKIQGKGSWVCDLCKSIVNKMPQPVPIPGPSMSMSSRNEDIQSPRNHRGRRKRTASSTRETPVLKAAVVEKKPEEIVKDSASESPKCLYDNGGQPIHVVKLDNIESSDDKVIEIGGVNIVPNTATSENRGEAESNETPINNRLSRLLNPSRHRSEHALLRRNTHLPTNEPPCVVIDLLDSDDESPNINGTNSKLPTINVDDDDDVIFVGRHEVTKPTENNQAPAMIRITRNDNVVVLSASEVIRQDNPARQTTAVAAIENAVTSIDNNTSNIMWQSVPRHKSMVHTALQNPIQTVNSSHDKNLVHDTVRTTSSVKEQRWVPRLLPNGSTSSNNHRREPVTDEYVIVSEVIDLD